MESQLSCTVLTLFLLGCWSKAFQFLHLSSLISWIWHLKLANFLPTGKTPLILQLIIKNLSLNASLTFSHHHVSNACQNIFNPLNVRLLLFYTEPVISIITSVKQVIYNNDSTNYKWQSTVSLIFNACVRKYMHTFVYIKTGNQKYCITVNNLINV